jgi:hypothetical protein
MILVLEDALYLVAAYALLVLLILHADRIISAFNQINHNATVFLLFMLGVFSAFVGFVLIARFPAVDHDIAKGLAGLGAMIVGGAMMAFRGGADSSSSIQRPDGSTTTRAASVSGDPTTPILPAAGDPAPKS